MVHQKLVYLANISFINVMTRLAADYRCCNTLNILHEISFWVKLEKMGNLAFMIISRFLTVFDFL